MIEREPRRIVVPDPSVVVLVGAAGAGKSTFAARHFAPDEILSSDAYRAVISGDPSDQRATRPAFAALHRSLARRSNVGRLSVVDATNVQAHARRAILARARAAGLPAIAIVLDLPPDLVRARNGARSGGEAVPDDAVLTQLDDLARTLHADPAVAWSGFDAVHVLRAPGEVDGLRLVRVERLRPDPPGPPPAGSRAG